MLHAIHVDDSKHPEHYSYGEEHHEPTEDYHAPILADDEIDAGPDVAARHPAIRPGMDRSRSYDADEPKRPSIRHPSVHESQPERDFNSTPLEDVEEYEPLFDEEKKEEEKKQAAAEKRASRHFPSKDIWEDAPSSVHYSTEVSTPDVDENGQRPKSKSSQERSITPAQAFAQYQEQLAEKEAKSRSHTFLPLSAEPQAKPTWIDHQSHLGVSKPATSKRFPSKDIWEDAPDSHIHEVTLSESPPPEDDAKSPEEAAKPEIPSRPSKKAAEESKAAPAIPTRPKPRQLSGDDAQKQPPPVSDKPKPQLPARPAKKFSGESKDGEAVKPPKPPVPSRPVGGKIAALQAGFMSDLNKRLQLGPQAMKKDEPAEEEVVAEKEKAPLSDARKGRARGPQRRAPAAKAVSPVKEPSASVLSMSLPQTLWSIDPDDGTVITTSHQDDVEQETGKPLQPETGEGSSSVVVEEPSPESDKPDPTPAGKADVAAQANPAEPTLADNDVEADLDEPAAKPAVKVDEASEDIVSAKVASPETEEKPTPKVDAAPEPSKDEGEVDEEAAA